MQACGDSQLAGAQVLPYSKAEPLKAPPALKGVTPENLH